MSSRKSSALVNSRNTDALGLAEQYFSCLIRIELSVHAFRLVGCWVSSLHSQNTNFATEKQPTNVSLQVRKHRFSWCDLNASGLLLPTDEWCFRSTKALHQVYTSYAHLYISSRLNPSVSLSVTTTNRLSGYCFLK